MTSIMEIKEQSDHDVEVLRLAAEKIREQQKQLTEATRLLREAYRFMPVRDAYRFASGRLAGEDLAGQILDFLRLDNKSD